MAQTKAAKSKAPKRKKPTQRASSTAKKSTSRSSANGASGGIRSVRDAIGDAGEKAGHATSQVASKGKIPLIAGGAALFGAAGGMALNAARSGGGKVLGVNVPRRKRVRIRSKDLAKTATNLASFGEQVGAVSAGLRNAQELGGNGSGAHNSPLEVLLQGLTRRR
jgi:hypothetical protein